MTIIPEVLPPLPRASRWERNVPATDAFLWLAQGWLDFSQSPIPSLIYGGFVFLLSLGVVGLLFESGWDYVLLPAIAGFMVVGPLVAVGLYEKSRRVANGAPVRLLDMICVRTKSATQIFFAGLLLLMLMLLWMRAAVIIFALFVGLRPFPGLHNLVTFLFGTGTGWTIISVGIGVGGAFAAFAFAISVFSVPMLLAEDVDAATAMGSSVALVWHNKPSVLTWGVIVLVLFAVSVATAFVGLIVIFPLLGHGTWHAYERVALDQGTTSR